MGQLGINDYIEHWEDGIGKIIQVDEKFIVVNFLKHGEIEVPIVKTTFYKKLNPVGLLAQIYENQEYIQELIRQESTEIIKLLIYDIGKLEDRKIETSHIKNLLTKTKSERGWGRNFGLIKEENWQKWWKTVNAKLKEDVWFDASSKSIIVLREKPVSKTQNMYEQFLAAKGFNKKISICEQLVEACNKDEDQSILKDLAEFITEIIQNNSQDAILYSAVFSAIQLSDRGVTVESFSGKTSELTFKTLKVRRNLIR